MTGEDRPQNTRNNCELCDRINTHTDTHWPKTWKQNQPSLLHRWTVENIEGQINYGPHAHIHVNVHKNKLEHAHTKTECPSKQTSADIPQFWCFRLYNLHNRRWQTRISHWWDNVMKLLNDGHQTLTYGKAGIARWLERRTRDRKVAGSSPGRSGGTIFFSRVDFLGWLLFRYPLHPCTTAVSCT